MSVKIFALKFLAVAQKTAKIQGVYFCRTLRGPYNVQYEFESVHTAHRGWTEDMPPTFWNREDALRVVSPTFLG